MQRLGVLYDSVLLFNGHISNNINRSNKMLGLLGRNFKEILSSCFLNNFSISMVR